VNKSGATRLKWFACVICLLLASGAPVYGSSGTFQAFGYVRDASGNPIPNLDVSGDDYVGDVYTFKTDATGYYSVDFDSDGNYRITPSCAQLNGLGFACVPGVAITVADASVNVDFVVKSQPFQVTTTSLPRGNVGINYSAQLAAAGGKAPFSWRLASDSGDLPAGLNLSASGLISGLPAAYFSASVKIQVTDANLSVTNKVFSITINPIPTLTANLWATNRFTLFLTGGSNQNYTIQVSSNLAANVWSAVIVTNHHTANSFIIVDGNATNLQRTYRIVIGP
jgi:hypothetical protein